MNRTHLLMIIPPAFLLIGGLIYSGYTIYAYGGGMMRSEAQLEDQRRQILPADGPAVHPSERVEKSQAELEEAISSIEQAMLRRRLTAGICLMVVGVGMLFAVSRVVGVNNAA